MKKIELLAPAGDFERLKTALQYGADAVYIGGVFNLRANANNFDITEIKKGIDYAHKLNKKVYVTVNIALHNKEYQKITSYLISLDKINVDAIIISDPAIIPIVQKHTNLEIHLSTQASTLNKEAIEFWEEEGVSRIVLARECTKEDIIDIKKNTKTELEVFIHGAMCASYSGRCVLSNYLTNRDSNRGGCSQICRWDFDLYENNNHLKGEKPFTFCTKDLSQMKYVPELIDIGISSLKIEGRMRSAYYIATVVKIYRKIIDEYYNGTYQYNPNDEKILRRCANRDSISQFYDGTYDETVQYYNGRTEITNQDFLGNVISYKDGYAKIEQRNHFKINDEVIIFGPKEEIKFKIKELYDENMNSITVAPHPKQIVYINCPKPISSNYMMKRI